MARIAVLNYTFVKGAANAGTVTFTDYSAITASSILGIVNTTRGAFIYNPTDSTKLGTVATNVLTLSMDTSAMANTDKLTILYEPDTGDRDLPFVGQAAQTATVNNIIPVAVSSSATDLLGYKSASIQIICPAGTYTTGAITFEGANDSATGTSFQAFPVVNQSAGTVLPASAITLVSSTGITYIFPINFRYIRVRISTAVSGASASVQAVSVFSKASYNSIYSVQPSGANLNVTLSSGTVSSIGTSVTPGTGAGNLGKAEDAAAANGDTGLAVFSIRNDALTNNTSATGDYQGMTGNKWGASYVQQYEKSAKTFSVTQVVTVAAAATDIAILPGNATNTVYVTKIIVSGIQTTAGTSLIQIFKRSTADTLGTTGTFTVVPHDSADTAVSVPLVYTANPTTGTGVLMRAEYINVGSTTSLSSKFEMTAGDLGKHGILSGATQGLAINLNGVTFTGGSFTVYYQWFEL